MTAPAAPAVALPEAVERAIVNLCEAESDRGECEAGPDCSMSAYHSSECRDAYAALRAVIVDALAKAEALGASRTIEAAAHEAARSHAALNDVCSILFCIEDRTEAARLISRVVADWATGQDADAIHDATVNGHEWTEAEMERLAAAVRASDSVRAEETTDGD